MNIWKITGRQNHVARSEITLITMLDAVLDARLKIEYLHCTSANAQ